MPRTSCVKRLLKVRNSFVALYRLAVLRESLARSQRFWSGVSMLLLLVSLGCSTAAPPPAVVTEIVELPDPTPPIPYPQPLALETFEWTVMAPGYWRDPDQVYFCLDPSGYEAAARNNGQLLRFTREVMWQLRYYNQEQTDDGMGRVDEGVDQ